MRMFYGTKGIAFALAFLMGAGNAEIPVAAQEVIEVISEESVTAEETDIPAEAEEVTQAGVSSTASMLSQESSVTPYDGDEIPAALTSVVRAAMDARGRVRIQWKKFPGAKSYRVFRYEGDQSTGKFKLIWEGKGLSCRTQAYSYADSTLYKVQGYAADQSPVDSYSAICAPTALSLSCQSSGIRNEEGLDTGSSVFEFRFTHSQPSVHYVIRYAESAADRKAGNWKEIEFDPAVDDLEPYKGTKVKADSVVAAKFSRNDLVLETGNTYFFKVCAYVYDKDGNRLYSADSAVLKAKALLPPVECQAVTYKATKDGMNTNAKSVNIIFSQIEDAFSYEIFSSPKPDGTYQKVKTVKAQTAREESNLFFDGSSVQSRYSVTRIDKGIKPETMTYFKVRAVKKNAQGTAVRGAFSDPAGVMTHLGNVTDLSLEEAGESNYIRVNFTPVTGADSYNVYRRIYGDGTTQWSRVAENKKGTLSNGYRYIIDETSLKTGKTYEYRVIPVYKKKECAHSNGENMERAHFTCVESKGKFTLTATSLTSIRVKWKGTEGAQEYGIRHGYALDEKGDIMLPPYSYEVKITPSEYPVNFKKRYYDIEGSGIVQPFKTMYVQYYYVVDGEKHWSNVKGVAACPGAVSNLKAEYSQNGAGASLTWKAVKEVEKYIVERSTSKEFREGETVVCTPAGGIKATVFTDHDTLVTGRTYYYRVAGYYFDQSSKTYQTGVYTVIPFSKPREIKLFQIDSNKNRVSVDGTTITVEKSKKGFTGDFQIDFYNENGNAFTPSVDNVTWRLNSGWASYTNATASDGKPCKRVVIQPEAPSGTIITFQVSTMNKGEYEGELVKTFSIKIK